MSLIIFVFAFVIVSCIIVQLATFLLENDTNLNYTTMYIKGTARGSMGLLESNSMLETKRAKLRKRNSKF